jgi:HD superfamily phosphohydrolase
MTVQDFMGKAQIMFFHCFAKKYPVLKTFFFDAIKTLDSEFDNNSIIYNVLRNIISGTLDADRLDYVSRDLFCSGVSRGIINYGRMFRFASFKEIKSDDSFSFSKVFDDLNEVLDNFGDNDEKIGGYIYRKDCLQETYSLLYDDENMEILSDIILLNKTLWVNKVIDFLNKYELFTNKI